MKRRTFLRRVGWTLGGGLALGAVGGGAFLAKIQPRRRTLPKRALDDATRPERLAGATRRVVVVGGGLAGIATATELAARGFDVTLVERAASLGGKVTGWPVKVPPNVALEGGASGAATVPMEHGFHGFFRQYYALNGLLDAAGVASDLHATDGYPVLFPDRPTEVFGTTSRLFPLNLGQVVVRSPSLKMMEFRDDGPGLTELMRYRPERTFADFDAMSFTEFMRTQGIHGGMVSTVLRPFGKTTLNALARLSAAEAIRFFHFYFMGNPEGLGFRCLGRDVMTAVIDPLRRRMEQLGVKVLTGRAVRRLVTDGKRVVAVELERSSAAPRVAVAAASVPTDGRWLPVATADGPLFVRRRAASASAASPSSAAYEALDGHCTHMGCPVAYVPQGGGPGTFHCPCHNGEYSTDGIPTAGPPPRPLAPVAAALDGDRVLLGGATALDDDRLPCDWCVVAADSRALRHLAADSHLDRVPGAKPFADAIARTGEADPFSVVRFWFDRPVRPDRAPFYTVSGYRYTDAIAIYSAFQEPSVSWARRSGGSVVETHAYAIEAPEQGTVAHYRDQLLAELRRALPELDGARILHEEAMAQDTFTRFAPGDWATRPSTVTPLANLLLAGDHVKLPFPAFLMEAAAASGRLAASHILFDEGLRELTIETVAPEGPLV